MKKIITLFSTMVFLACLTACGASIPQQGFRVHTTRTTITSGSLLPVTVDDPNRGVNGNFEALIPGRSTRGSMAGFGGFTNGSADLDISNPKLPAVWRFGETNGPCGGQSRVTQVLGFGLTIPLDCRQIPVTFFTYVPGMIQRDSPPSDIAINGTAISSSGGMPNVEYYDLNGNLVAQNAATWVASDGSALSAPTPNISALSSGMYAAVVRNPDGNIAGNGVMILFDFIEPPPDPDPDPGSCGNAGGNQQVCPVDYPAY